MLERSAPEIRPQLDLFFANLRAALEASAGGADRRRLEEFRVQAQGVQERLYACLERDERPELAEIARDLQVLAYRVRVLFGRPLEGVSWDAFQTLLAEMPRRDFVSGEVRGAREAAHLPERTLVARQATTGGGVLTAHARLQPPPANLRPEAVPPPENLAPAESAAEPAAEPTAHLEPATLASEDPAFDEAVAEPVAEPAAASWDFVLGPILVSCFIFLIGAFAGSALGGLFSPVTALACGSAALAIMRSASPGEAGRG